MRTASTVFALAAVAVAVSWHGGYPADAQWAFAGLAGAAALLAFVAAPARGLALVTQPPILVLLALGWLGAVSAWWTIGVPGAAYRAGALAAGYGALALTAAIRSRSALSVALVLGLVAVVTALLGLGSVALLSPEFAARVAGHWQAEGTFGYAPGLALVEVAALPLFLSGMLRARTGTAALAAACSALAAGAVVLAANRMTVALAFLVVGLPVLAPARTAGTTRGRAALAACLVAAGALGFHLAFGERTPRHAGGELGRMLVLVAIVVGTAAAWSVVRTSSAQPEANPEPGRPHLTLAGIAVLGAAAVAIAVLSTGALGEQFGPRTSFTHGRLTLARISYETFADRPLQGYGAGAYLRATLQRQEGRRHITRYAHDLPLEQAVELGVAGLVLAIALYLASALALWRARRAGKALWLLGPAVAAFLLVNLVDWPWHLAGVGALFALALGGILSRGAGAGAGPAPDRGL